MSTICTVVDPPVPNVEIACVTSGRAVWLSTVTAPPSVSTLIAPALALVLMILPTSDSRAAPATSEASATSWPVRASKLIPIRASPADFLPSLSAEIRKNGFASTPERKSLRYCSSSAWSDRGTTTDRLGAAAVPTTMSPLTLIVSAKIAICCAVIGVDCVGDRVTVDERVTPSAGSPSSLQTPAASAGASSWPAACAGGEPPACTAPST